MLDNIIEGIEYSCGLLPSGRTEVTAFDVDA